MSLGASPSFDAMSNFPGGFAQGLTVQGMPVLNTYPGRVFWLDSVNGSNSNRGTFARPFASLVGAQTVLAAHPPTVWNDILMVKPNHRESISSATAMILRQSGLTIIGLGQGFQRPTFTLDTANTATVSVLGSNITFQNVRFVNNFLNIASMFTLGGASVTASISGTQMTVTVVGSGTLYPGLTLNSATSGFIPGTKIVSQASGTTGGVGVYNVNVSQTVASGTITTVARDFTLRGCDISDTSAILNALIMVTTSGVTNAADGLTLTGNTISLLAASGATSLISAAGTNDRVVVSHNYYLTVTTNAAAPIAIATGKVLTNLRIVRNSFLLTGASGTATGLIVTTDGSTNSGMMTENFIQNLDATTPILATASSGLRFFENYYQSAADKSGAILPAIS